MLKNRSTKKLSYRPLVLSRHPSHNVLRAKNKNLPLFPFRTIIRLGSTTEGYNGTVVINSIESIKTSSNKYLMKQAFDRANAKTASWFKADANELFTKANELTDNWKNQLVCKAHYGSKGRGNTLVKSEQELRDWMIGKNLNNYLFEKFMNFGHEFRLHVTENECFYACRKALKRDVPEDQKWRRHDDICVWFLPTNPEFHMPNSMKDIIKDCQNALKEIGADILSFDVRVQSPTTAKGERRAYQEYILLECNSASSMDNGTGELSECAKKYIEVLPPLIYKKYKNARK